MRENIPQNMPPTQPESLTAECLALDCGEHPDTRDFVADVRHDRVAVEEHAGAFAPASTRVELIGIVEQEFRRHRNSVCLQDSPQLHSRLRVHANNLPLQRHLR